MFRCHSLITIRSWKPAPPRRPGPAVILSEEGRAGPPVAERSGRHRGAPGPDLSIAAAGHVRHLPGRRWPIGATSSGCSATGSPRHQPQAWALARPRGGRVRVRPPRPAGSGPTGRGSSAGRGRRIAIPTTRLRPRAVTASRAGAMTRGGGGHRLRRLSRTSAARTLAKRYGRREGKPTVEVREAGVRSRRSHQLPRAWVHRLTRSLVITRPAVPVVSYAHYCKN